MRIPCYWAKEEAGGFDASGKAVKIDAWGWSSDSLEDARSIAEERARRAIDRLATPGGERGDYDEYLNTPLREETIETIKHGGEEIGVITRNRYGALVLNTANVLFVDIDRPKPESQGLVGGLKSVFSRSKRETPILESHAEIIIRVVAWWHENPIYSFRLYATRAGLRLLFTNKLFDPVSEEVYRIFTELGSDLLYQRLTIKQESFRARLTPKPWRIGLQRPPVKFPYVTESATAAIDDWITHYDDTSHGFQVCSLLETFGVDAVTEPVIRTVIKRHDKAVLNGTKKPLA